MSNQRYKGIYTGKYTFFYGENIFQNLLLKPIIQNCHGAHYFNKISQKCSPIYAKLSEMC